MDHSYTSAILQYKKAMQEFKLAGEKKETSTREAFHLLVRNIIPPHYKVITEKTSHGQDRGNIIYYDLIFGHMGGSPIGYLEDKDPMDHLEKEIQKKRNQGYNFENLLFQDGKKASLFQENEKQQFSKTVNIENTQDFAFLLEKWVSYQDQNIQDFESSYKRFKTSVPELAKEIHNMIEEAYKNNASFHDEVDFFYRALTLTIGESITLLDVKEIIVQHIMTRDLFQTLLSSSFNKFNSISKLIETIISALGRGFEDNLHKNIIPYYQQLERSLQKLHNIHYEAEILRTFYEEFYKSYNPKQADTYGIVYTPIEVVNFMITLSDSLLQEYFGKNLATKGVQILDPCTGTGTFLAGLIQYFEKGDLSYKYQNDLHANEISILAYYIGSLYIERLYSALIPENLFQEFKNMCFVDTLDNVYADPIKHNINAETLGEGFGLLSELDEENSQKVKSQNEKDLLVIIGNPPYNVGQRNENQNNRNRAYPYIDKRIKDTYVKESQAQNKNKLYDMYTRFIRWSTDRIGEEGMVAFITNRSFLDAKGFDGFRKNVAQEFTYIHTLDLGGDIRKGNMGGNVFNIMVGVCITFFVKMKEPMKPPGIFYCNPFSPQDRKENKLNYLKELTENYTLRKNMPWQKITPTPKGDWIHQSISDFHSLPIVLANKENKALSIAQFQATGNTLFGLYSLGVNTNRDSWVYDKNAQNLAKKVTYFIDFYHEEVNRWQASDKAVETNHFVKKNIKWSSSLLQYFKSCKKASPFDLRSIRQTLYRPFNIEYLYYQKMIIHRPFKMPHIFPTGQKDENCVICVSQKMGANFEVLMSNVILDLHILHDTQCLPLFVYDSKGQKHSNLNTKMLKSWGEQLQFTPSPEQAFYYVYALLHHSEYRSKYYIDLMQNFPRIPLLINDFKALSDLGEQLAFFHLHFQEVAPFSDLTIETIDTKPSPLVKLRSYPTDGEILIDDNTKITGIPQKAWEYKLGNRSALDWALEGFKEKKISPDNGDIADLSSPLYQEYAYKAYLFSDYKNECLDIIPKIVTVCLETLSLIKKINFIEL